MYKVAPVTSECVLCTMMHGRSALFGVIFEERFQFGIICREI